MVAASSIGIVPMLNGVARSAQHHQVFIEFTATPLCMRGDERRADRWRAANKASVLCNG